jgi:7-cyano-7-deazaguanine synthase
MPASRPDRARGAAAESAVVLLSGGLDSAVALAIARRDGFEPIALTFRYGQRHAIEVQAARAVAQAAGVREHVVLDLDLRAIGGSALTGDEPIPKDRPSAITADGGGVGAAPLAASDIPATYVPARNTIFLACGLSLAEARGASDIYIGVNAVDYSGYPDCRPEYVAAFEKLARLATRAGSRGGALRVRAPLIHLSKAEIIRRGLELGLDFSLTRSCYDPDVQGRACGRCDSCLIRRRAFQDIGTEDPAPYAPCRRAKGRGAKGWAC